MLRQKDGARTAEPIVVREEEGRIDFGVLFLRDLHVPICVVFYEF